MKFEKKALSLLVCGHLIGAVAAPVLASDEQAKQIDSIIVSAKAPVDEAAFAGSVTVITKEEIQASGATDVKDVLASTPSVQLVVTGSSPSKAPQIRGQNAERALILINGKRIPNTDRNIARAPAFRYNLVPLANIEKIEIIRGPASSLYGADALAGIINIITHEASSEWSGAVNFFNEQTDTVNGGNSHGVSFSASGLLTDSVDLLIAAESTITDAILSDEDASSIQSEKEVSNLQLDLGINLSAEDRVKFGVISANEEGSDFDSTGAEETPIDVTNRIITAEYFTTLAGFDSVFSAVSGKSELLEGSGVWDIVENGVALDLQGQLSDKNYLSYGVNYREESVERDDTVVFSDDIQATTFFLQDVLDITANSSITLGFAYDIHSKYDDEVSPKLNWFTQLSPAVSFKMGYGESYLAPSLREASSQYIVNAGPSRRYVGNDDLQPETAKTFETALTFQQSAYSSSISLFRSEVEDLISTIDSDSGGVTIAEYNNVDEALLQGLELTWSLYTANRSKKLDFSYTFLDTEDLETGKELTDRSTHLAKLNYFHKSAVLGFDLDTAMRYVGKQYTNADNTEELEDYIVADIGVNRELAKGTSLRVGINNLTNRIILNSNDQLLESGRSFKFALTANF